jgi:DNA-binding NtrC family response regulator
MLPSANVGLAVYTTVLLADDDTDRRAFIHAALSSSLRVREVAPPNELPSTCRACGPDAVLIGTDSRTATVSFAVVDAIRSMDRRVPVLIIMQGGSELLAAAALRAGVSDYITYPVSVEELRASVVRALAPEAGTHATGDRSKPALIGSSAIMANLRAYLQQAAAGESNVLITGETGTGKELAAALVHQQSPRRLRPFVPVVCAAIPDALMESELFGHEKGSFTGATAGRMGLLQAAQGGTVFFDEVGDIGLAAQAKILRAIETREVYRVGGREPVPVDVRIVAATNRDLEDAVEQGTFRKDLYFRLNVARVHLPPLRERRGDIGQILDYYLHVFNSRSHSGIELSAEARQALVAYDWPGNVRELKNLVESLFVCPPGDPVRIDDFPELFRRKLQSYCSLDDRERRILLDALFSARWNKSRAAEILQCSRMTLYRRMAKYSVVPAASVSVRRTTRSE